MEKIRKTQCAVFRPVKLNQQDLEELVGYFQSMCTEVTISDNNNIYDSLAEMRRIIGPETKCLSIVGENPSVKLALNENREGEQLKYSEIRTFEATDAADALFDKVYKLLASHLRRGVNWSFAAALVFSLTLIGMFAYGFNLAFRRPHLFSSWALAANILLCFGFWILTGKLGATRLLLDSRTRSSFGTIKQPLKHSAMPPKR